MGGAKLGAGDGEGREGERSGVSCARKTHIVHLQTTREHGWFVGVQCASSICIQLYDLEGLVVDFQERTLHLVRPSLRAEP